MKCPNCLENDVVTTLTDCGDHLRCHWCGRLYDREGQPITTIPTRRSAYYRFPSSLDELLGR